MNVLHPMYKKHIHSLVKDGFSYSAISRELGLNRDTVAKYAREFGATTGRGRYARPVIQK